MGIKTLLPLTMIVLVSVSSTRCVVDPDSDWTLEEASIVALEVRRAGSPDLLAGDPFSPVDDSVAVERGAELELTAISLGSSSCRAGALFETVRVGDNLLITLIDSVRSGPDIACTDDLAPLPRVIPYVVDATGNALIEVKGNPSSKVTFLVTP